MPREKGTWSGRYYRCKHRLMNVVLDFYERWIERRCCHYLVRDEGGYNHWRCGRPAGHEGAHRFNNYVWPSLTFPLRVVYDPYSSKEPESWPWPPILPAHLCRRLSLRKREREALDRRRQEKPWDLAGDSEL